MRPRSTGTAAVLAAVGLVAVGTPAGAQSSDDGSHDLADAFAATSAYQDVAAAEAAGWELPPEGPLHECISGIDLPGAMGLHYINSTNAGDTILDPAAPAALVYEPTADGGLELVAAEWVVFAEAWDAEYPDEIPELFGHELMYVPEPNRFELPAFYQIHAWLWRDNPAGVHAGFNVDASCQYATPAATVTTGGT